MANMTFQIDNKRKKRDLVRHYSDRNKQQYHGDSVSDRERNHYGDGSGK